MIKWAASELVESDCNLCGLKSNELLLDRPDGLRVVQCKNCGLVYIDPRPEDDLIPLLYSGDYFSSQSGIGYDNYFSDEVQQGMLSASKERLRVLEENGIRASGDALEVGCATGELCSVLHSRGVNVTGIDISESAIAKARSRYRAIPFHTGTIDDVDSEAEYDAIFAYEVIEHLIDPDGFFGKASELLAKNGFLCITTPSFECAESVGFDNWIGFSTSFEHLYFFSSTTIGRYAAKHIMEVAHTLYGGGKGRNNQTCSQCTRKETITRILLSMRLLEPIRRIRHTIRSTRSIRHNYQPNEIEHSLLMILRKI